MTTNEQLAHDLRQLADRLLANETPAPPPAPKLEFLDVAGFAKHLDVSPTTVRRQILQGLPHRRVGKLIRIPVAQALAWLDAR